MSRKRRGWLLFLVAVVIVGLLIYSKLHIVIWVRLGLVGFLVLVGGMILFLFLILRMIFDR